MAGASRIIGVDLNSNRFEEGQIFIHFPKEDCYYFFFFFLLVGSALLQHS